MRANYDVVIVGARCAGAALGIHLARAGVKVLLVDASKLPSDQVLSTHYIHPPGMDALDALGVGEKARAAAPPTRTTGVIVDRHRLLSTYPDGRSGRSIRRFKLDTWLQEAAVAAGAELKDRHRVTDLVRAGDRVTGVVLETPAGPATVKADLVVGADGPHSTVASLTGVEEYLTFDLSRSGYWFYWPATAAWRACDYQLLLALEGDGLRYAFHTDDDLMLLLAAPPREEARAWGADYRRKYLDYLRASPVTAPLIEGSEPIGKGAGFIKARCFYRRPVGPGFALVGDAGNFKDYVTGHGITDALLGASWLAEAILDGRQGAFDRYWRRRDASTLPLYFDAQRLGATGANTPLLRLIMQRMAGEPARADRFSLASDRRLDPAQAVKTGWLIRWVLGSVLRGRPAVLGSFLAMGRSMATAEKEIAARRRLLAEAERALEQAPAAHPPPARAAGAQ